MALTLVTDTDSVTESETDSVGDCASGVVVDGYPCDFLTASIWPV